MILSTTPRLTARDRSGLPVGLSGTPVDQYWIGAPPTYYTSGLAQAKSAGYSIPIQAAPKADGGVVISYVNPDGTLGQIFDWQTWPLKTVTSDSTFISPPNQATWTTLITAIGVQAYAAASAQAHQQQQTTATPPITMDTNPQTFADDPVSTTTCDANSLSLAGYCIPYLYIGIAAAAWFFLGGKRR